MEQDILLKTTLAYQKLLNTKYVLTIGKGKNLLSYSLTFDINNYKHLLGLHKLDKLPKITQSASERIYDNISNDGSIRKEILENLNFPQIQKRIEGILELENMLDKVGELYKWDFRKSPSQSKINADILLTSPSKIYNNTDVLAFFTSTQKYDKKGKKVDVVLKLENFFTHSVTLKIPVSFFLLENAKNRYTQNQERPATILYKEKTDLKTGATIILLDKFAEQAIKKQAKETLQNAKNTANTSLPNAPEQQTPTAEQIVENLRENLYFKPINRKYLHNLTNIIQSQSEIKNQPDVVMVGFLKSDKEKLINALFEDVVVHAMEIYCVDKAIKPYQSVVKAVEKVAPNLDEDLIAQIYEKHIDKFLNLSNTNGNNNDNTL
jgi:hypothetical protein